MINTVLVDAGPLIALFDKDDFYHKSIKIFMSANDFRLIPMDFADATLNFNPQNPLSPKKTTKNNKKTEKSKKNLTFPKKNSILYLYDVKNPTFSERPCGSGGACLGFV